MTLPQREVSTSVDTSVGVLVVFDRKLCDWTTFKNQGVRKHLAPMLLNQKGLVWDLQCM
jgi:hypothetical protein